MKEEREEKQRRNKEDSKNIAKRRETFREKEEGRRGE